MLLDRDAPLFLRGRYLLRLLPWLVPFLQNGRADKIEQIAGALSVLTHDTTYQHRALSSGTAAAQFIRTGDFVNLYPTRADFDQDKLANGIRARFGIKPEFLDRNQLLERDPHLGPACSFGTVFSQYSWITSPGAYVKSLFDHFISLGGRFESGEVVDIRPGDTPQITLSGGRIMDASKIALCAGA